MSLKKVIKETGSVSSQPEGGDEREVTMIAVIADDLTGAAEIGGLGLRYNLRVEIATEVDANTDAELLIISADTRSIKEEDAVSKIKQITGELLALQPVLIYKKIDSVLRGHVVAELQAQMKVMQRARALVIPANPSLERTIRDGHYYFKGAPIHLSSFSKDPEFPIRSSSVTDMLRADDVSVLKLQEALPASGIAVAEVVANDDLHEWARKVDRNTLLAGASGFFTALLENMQVYGDGLQEIKANGLGEPMLFVCGTTFSKSRIAIREVKAKGGPVSYMPTAMVTSSSPSNNDFEEWSTEIVELLSAKGRAIIAIEESTSSTRASANDLREKTACTVEKVLQKIHIRELVVEGGSTAASIVGKQGFTRLVPVKELSPGLIRMRVKGKEDLHLTIKPGSYEWSPELWKF